MGSNILAYKPFGDIDSYLSFQERGKDKSKKIYSRLFLPTGKSNDWVGMYPNFILQVPKSDPFMC